MKSPQSILLLTESYYPNRGGMAQSCDRIVAGLRSAGLNVDILHFTGRAPAWELRQEQGGTYLACPAELNESHTLNRAWNWLSRPTAKQDYDLLIAFGGHLPLLGAPIFSQWLAIPLMVLLRGNDFDAAIFSPKRYTVLQKAIAQASRVCAVSSEKIKKTGQMWPDTPGEFIANGIDLQDWTPLPSDLAQAQRRRAELLPEGKLMLGMIGQLKPKKGFDFLLAALDRAHTTDKVHLLVVGDLPETSRAALAESGLTWSELPFMDRYELLSVYPACDAVAIPSFYDGMPNVLLEALGLGIPVLAADVDGLHDVLSGQACGWLFHPGDLAGCAEALRALLSAGAEGRRAAGEAGHHLIATHYTAERETAAYQKAIAATISAIHSSTSNVFS